MEIFGWSFSDNADESLPTHLLVAAGAVAIAIGYPVGYLLIDVFQWIALTPEQSQGGYIHVFRVFAGFLAMALPMMAWMAWESRDNLRE